MLTAGNVGLDWNLTYLVEQLLVKIHQLVFVDLAQEVHFLQKRTQGVVKNAKVRVVLPIKLSRAHVLVKVTRQDASENVILAIR